VFRGTGTTHLLALSGLHVGLLAGAILILMRKMTGRGWFTLVAVSLVCGTYALISGGRASTLRAWIMLTALLMLWQLSGRTPHLIIVWSVAAIILIASSGGSVLQDVGARMSFAAVLTLIIMGRRFHGRLGWFLSAGFAGLAVTVALAPMVSDVYGGFHPVAPLATVASIPLMVSLMLLGSAAVIIPAIPGLPELAEWTAYIWLTMLRTMGTGEIVYRTWMTAVWTVCLLGLLYFGRRGRYLFRFR
jgi:competence protein ComEC